MAGKIGFYTHETLNFPVSGGNEQVVSLPETDLWSGIPSQNSVESSLYDIIYSEDSNLLSSSTELRFHSRPSLHFSDLSDR